MLKKAAAFQSFRLDDRREKREMIYVKSLEKEREGVLITRRPHLLLLSISTEIFNSNAGIRKLTEETHGMEHLSRNETF